MNSKPEKNYYTELSRFKKNKENPFLKQAVEEINQNVVKRYKNVSGTNKSAILQAVNSDGELVGHTQFIRQIVVDEKQFAKFYLSNFSAFFDLKPSAIKVFGYILEQLKPNKDSFEFYMEDCLEFTGYKSKVSVFKGLTQLIKNHIIARGRTEYHYFINPMIVFNGNRITFAKTYVKKKKPKQVDPNQTNLLDAIAEAEAKKRMEQMEQMASSGKVKNNLP